MKYEIRSRETGKVIYEATAEDVAKDWNFKKKMLVMGKLKNKKLFAHISKHGLSDLYLEIPEEKPKKKPSRKSGGRKELINI